jgi:hypothetical protein
MKENNEFPKTLKEATEFFADADAALKFAAPAGSVDISQLETEFNQKSKRWKNETKFQSAISAIVMHPDYLDIIGMGQPAIKFILRDLKKETNHWFTALRALTKASPVKPEDAGNLKKMRDAWLKWGKENGYLD